MYDILAQCYEIGFEYTSDVINRMATKDIKINWNTLLKSLMESHKIITQWFWTGSKIIPNINKFEWFEDNEHKIAVTYFIQKN